MKKLVFSLILIIFILYGIYLRGYELSTGSFWIDEGYSSIISYFMTQNHFLPKLAGGMYEFSQYFFHFFQALIFTYFGASDFTSRLPSFIFSILFIFVYYIFSLNLLKESKYKNIGVIFLMFLFLFSTWQIIWSREARFYEMLAILYLTITFLLYKYIQVKKQKYLNILFIFLFIGLIFHHFFLAFVPIVAIILLFEFSSHKNFKSLFFLSLTLVGYFAIQLFLKVFFGGSISIGAVLPNINYVEQYHFFLFFSFYLQVFIEQLGIIFYLYLLTIFYFLFMKKWREFLLFGGIFVINIISISFGYFAHSRYMFHLFSIMTLLGGYGSIMILEYCLEKYKNIYGKIGALFLIGFLCIGLFQSFNFTFIPQRFYYIDVTSPKPNFKTTYEYIKTSYPESKIISGFPHMCYWYNMENTTKCEYALPMNLVGSLAFNESILKRGMENHTAIEYVDNFSEIDQEKYVFVFDDLTLKNTIAKDFVSQVISECSMVYKDVGNQQVENFIGVWKCE